MATQSSYPGTPRWVKVSGIIVGILGVVVMLVAVFSSGAHGPGRHFQMPSDEQIRVPTEPTARTTVLERDGAREGGN